MTLNVSNQLTLLSDILDEQHGECCASVSECQQIGRLVQSILDRDQITDEQLLTILPEIYNYGRQGEQAQSLPNHVSSNIDNIKHWINAIEQTNLK
ncbi:YtzH-like family protein [Oceanobacillus sp. 1P07AA]|uniref:YtzH-like family protein n=1 Tax=Oceanobacillus sp. 1P07AA TaxID=3132293 RepID=UPI0039A5FA58